jgi:hypothetical protein
MLLNHIREFLTKHFSKLCQHVDFIHNQYQHAALACSLLFEPAYSLRYLLDSCIASDYNLRRMEVLIPPQL